ncbi:UMP kinase [Candidatus Erwinia haradaeae]|uniref:Uridylate kinase n=1 Tax=Candidatus Erwinia haradaeae TaxID=1922217 RepID=A0A803FT65_9GAMM|nr:UMP kinase [Candidatus Erwinia haradaeae]VFP87625.1 Uridylate kinase [Candidatus Erwinia haradaeae]
MITNIKLIYKRILLKISGEALKGSEVYGIDIIFLKRIVMEVKELVELGVQVGIVVGGGNLFRGSSLVKDGMSPVVADHMGMLATVINGLAMYDALNHAHVEASLMSSIPLNGLCDSYSWAKAIRLLYNNRVLVFSSGTGNPFFTTDSAACLRGIEIEADVVLKATKVDGVYSSDPMNHSDAVLYERLSYSEVLKKELTVMDLAAFTLARDHSLPICIFNINKIGALRRILLGDKEGTLITN